MLKLKFSYNWNNKLNCNSFTTVRLYNPVIHIVGSPVDIYLKDQSLGTGVIKAVSRFWLADVSPFISYLDTGYSPEEFKNIIHKMYQRYDFSKSQMGLLLIVKDKK